MSRHQVIVGRVILGVLCALVLCCCRSIRRSQPPVVVTSGDERAVWEALLREAYVSEETKVVVLDSALYSSEDGTWGSKPRGVPSDAWQGFLVACRTGGSLPGNLDVGVPVAWFEDGQIEDVPSGDGSFYDLIEGRWSAFHRRFPGNSGHISISRIGFSRDGRTALVYGFVGRGSLSASGDLFLLRRTDQGWRLVKTHNLAIA